MSKVKHNLRKKENNLNHTILNQLSISLLDLISEVSFFFLQSIFFAKHFSSGSEGKKSYQDSHMLSQSYIQKPILKYHFLGINNNFTA